MSRKANWDDVRSAAAEDATRRLAEALTIKAHPKTVTTSLLEGLCGSTNRTLAYSTVYIPKRRGGVRELAIPNPTLMWVQRSLLWLLEEAAEAHRCAKGFVRGKGVLDHAAVHLRKRSILVLDLQDFFPSITWARLFGMFQVFPFLCPRELARVLANLTTNAGLLPQGAPTSPFLSNIIARRLDSRLLRWAVDNGYDYSRYADDLAFSTSRREVPDVCRDEINSIIHAEGFRVNERKVRLLPRSRRQIVTGILLNNSRPALPREYTRSLRAILFNVSRYGWRSQVERRVIFGNFEDYMHYLRRGRSRGDFLELADRQRRERLLLRPSALLHPDMQNPQIGVKDRIERFKNVLGGRIDYVGQIYGRKHKKYDSLKSAYDILLSYDDKVSEYAEELRNILGVDPELTARRKIYSKFTEVIKKMDDAAFASLLKTEWSKLLEFAWLEQEARMRDLKQMKTYAREVVYKTVMTPQMLGEFFRFFGPLDGLGGLIHERPSSGLPLREVLERSESHFRVYQTWLPNRLRLVLGDFLGRWRERLIKKNCASCPWQDSDKTFVNEVITPFRKAVRMEDGPGATSLIEALERMQLDLQPLYPEKTVHLPSTEHKFYTDVPEALSGIRMIIHSMMDNSKASQIRVDCRGMNGWVVVTIEDIGGKILKEPDLKTLFSTKLRGAVDKLRGLAEWKIYAEFNSGKMFRCDVMSNSIEPVSLKLEGVKHELTFFR